MAAVERYVRYVVDRYGAWVDFWELMNEASVPDAWYATVARYLRSIDPYHHPIGTSWSRPDLREIDFRERRPLEAEEHELDAEAVPSQRRHQPVRVHAARLGVDVARRVDPVREPEAAVVWAPPVKVEAR
jgi:hypothetical protein